MDQIEQANGSAPQPVAHFALTLYSNGDIKRDVGGNWPLHLINIELDLAKTRVLHSAMALEAQQQAQKPGIVPATQLPPTPPNNRRF